jgi:hypothetical protein
MYTSLQGGECGLVCEDYCVDISPDISSCCSSYATGKVPIASLTCLPGATTSVTSLHGLIQPGEFGCEFASQGYWACVESLTSFEALPSTAQANCLCGSINAVLPSGIPPEVTSCYTYLSSLAPGILDGYRNALGNICAGGSGNAPVTV